MATRSYEHAVQALKNRIGARWEGVETQGRDELADALQQELDISHGEATDLVEAMIESGDLTYRHGSSEEGVGGVVAGVVPAGLGGGAVGAGSSGIVGVPAVPVETRPGYWQIGTSESEDGAEPLVRGGQVDPTR